MREENPSWFSRCEEELPSPEELMPLSQSLITPDLALAFQIQIPNHRGTKKTATISDQQQESALPSQQPLPGSPADFGLDSTEIGMAAAAGAADEPARTLKRPRLVWTPQLHKRFVDAVAHLGIKNAVPKTIMQLMNVDGLTRENVASHLQKYRLYLKRVQGITVHSGGGGSGKVCDPMTDHLFATSPVPAHFLSPGRVTSENLMQSFVPQQQMAATAHHHMQPPQYHCQRPTGHYVGPPHSRQFEYSFPSIYIQQPIRRMGMALQDPVSGYAEDLGSANTNAERKFLTLFPTADD